ncbi:hypothetical protein [Mixta mediterraneensis]|uniref:hypothetical protein n=1 Tax=Mixta mediterraneensis TaxID=2758443 RepID=UPI0018741D97|nr:hypothetical protein [Mixta mediterraneensis]MBE5254528.1 hypothetical protein [Mixta mediterraneensis]
MLNPIKWLLTKAEPATRETIMAETTDVQPVASTVSATETASPAAEVKAGVKDFEAALAFVESGVAQLGEAAKDELKALAKKYL